MARFPIGSMRQQVAIQRRATSIDAVGGQSQSWNTIQSGVWCSVEYLSGNELAAAQSIRATDTHRISMRYYPTLSAKDRMLYLDPEGTAHYYYLSDVIDLDMGHLFMVCTANEGKEIA